MLLLEKGRSRYHGLSWEAVSKRPALSQALSALPLNSSVMPPKHLYDQTE